MIKKLLLFNLSFVLLCISITFSQEDGEAEEFAFPNPEFSPNGPQSIFEDGQPIHNSDWEWLHPTPSGNTLRWVKRWDASNWYAVGAGGTFIKTTDGGATWFVNKWINGGGATGSNYFLYDAHFFDANTGVAVGSNGKIVRTTDAGLSWTIIDPAGATSTFWDVFFLNATVGYAGGTTTMDIWKTTDAGITWTGPIVIPGTCYNIYAVDEDTIYYSSTSGNFRRSTDGGASWTTISTGAGGTLYGMKFTDAFNGWVCGSGDNPAYTTDGGLTWTVTPAVPTTSTQWDVDILSTTTQTLNEGFEDPSFPPAGWHTKNILGPIEWFRSTGSSHSGVASARVSWDASGGEDWLVTPQVAIVTGDSLKFWARKLFSTVYEPDTIEVRVSTTDTSVASFTDVIYKNSVNVAFNTTWDKFAFDLSTYNGMNIYIAFRHYDVDGNGMYLDDVSVGEQMTVDQVFITGDFFNVYTTIDMGVTFSPIPFLGSPQPWTSTYYSSDFAAANDFVTVGAFGLINEVTPVDAATVYTTFLKGGSLYTIYAESPTGNVIVGGQATSTTAFDQAMYSTDGGETWAVSVVEDSVDFDFNEISMVTPLIGYAAREDHYVSKTTDGGATWFPVTRPAVLTADLETCWFIDENVGYVFGASGNGYKTTDGGTSWTSLTTGMGTSVIYGCYFLDANNGYIVGASGKIFMTTDGGTSFTQQTSNNTSTIRDIYFVNSNVGYCSGSSGKVRKTTDGGVTWDTADVGNTSPTLYEIDFKTEVNGFTAGSSGRTFYTTDGGATWNFENTGMSTTWSNFVEKTSPDTATVFVCGTFGYVMKNSVVVVPVELASFTASVSGNNVTLNWVTATELNNLGFEIERRPFEGDWAKVGFVDGKGTTTEPQQYEFTDAGLVSGTFNYRIKQIDYDGSYKYYNLEELVEIGVPVRYDLSQNYPNPFNPSTKIKYSVPVDGFVNIAVYNVLGEKVVDIVNAVQKAGSYEVTFDASSFASGMYIYRMESGDFVSIKKMMILK